jgi:hypothetical protein
MLPWIALVVVLSASAYGLQSAVLAIAPTASAASAIPATSNPALDGATLLDDALVEEQGLPSDATSPSSRPVVVMITARDSTAGDHMQVQCVTASTRIGSDTRLVDVMDLRDVASGACGTGGGSGGGHAAQ